MPTKNKKGKERLDKHILFRMNTEEYYSIKKKAKEAGLTMSAFIRIVQTKNQPVFDNRVKAEYVRQLNAIGTNFNQIVRGFHMKMLPTSNEFENIRKELQQLNELIANQETKLN